MIWQAFADAAPELARSGRERLDGTRAAVLGTLRRDGWPRISPIGPSFIAGHLLFGVMRSAKVQDLLRDPRCVLHSSIADIDGSEGEFKVYGRAVLVDDPELRNAGQDVWWRAHPAEAAHVFSLDIDSAAFVEWDPERGRYTVTMWSASSGVRKEERSYP
jgi:Pyridoxamine 5'-phosphate oxidase